MTRTSCLRDLTLPAEQGKAKRANDILTERDLALSVQVLQEPYVQATRTSLPDPITHQQAVRLIESFRRFPVQDVTSAILMAALDTRQRFQLSYWTPRSSRHPGHGCTEVLSEDLGDGQDYAGVRVTNPFAEPAEPVPKSVAEGVGYDLQAGVCRHCHAATGAPGNSAWTNGRC